MYRTLHFTSEVKYLISRGLPKPETDYDTKSLFLCMVDTVAINYLNKAKFDGTSSGLQTVKGY